MNVKSRQPFDYLKDLHGLWHPGVEEPHVSVHTANTGVSQGQAVPGADPKAQGTEPCACLRADHLNQAIRAEKTRTLAFSISAAEFPLMSLLFGTIHKALRAVQTALRSDPLVLLSLTAHHRVQVPLLVCHTQYTKLHVRTEFLLLFTVGNCVSEL